MTARCQAARLRGRAVRDCGRYEGPPAAWTRSVAGSVQGGPGGHTEAGQGLVEYGLILAIMAVACVVSLVFFGDQLSSLFSLIASAV